MGPGKGRGSGTGGNKTNNKELASHAVMSVFSEGIRQALPKARVSPHSPRYSHSSDLIELSYKALAKFTKPTMLAFLMNPRCGGRNNDDGMVSQFTSISGREILPGGIDNFFASPCMVGASIGRLHTKIKDVKGVASS